RRLAARAAARFMARTIGERAGETVGYRVRLDTRVSPETRIEVVTEGVLTRMLQSDPALEGVGLVIFDEFHERSLHADLGLALVLQARAVLRPELRILVMSATLEGGRVSRLLGRKPGSGAGPGASGDASGVPIVRSDGRIHPVETRFLERRVEGRIEPVVVRTVLRAFDEEEGDVLVFLPGAGEIRRVEAALEERGLPARVRLAPLYGRLSPGDQDRAIEPSGPGERKVVLSTPIAESSLTIEGVRVVVDSGLVRVPRFSPRTGMTRLETVAVSRASADQRRGRAGRLGPGVCYRLWTEAEDRRLTPHAAPEIREADLAPVALELAAWGVDDPSELRWLDPPPASAYAQAAELLRWLGALDEDDEITDHGRAMAELGMHPRLAHMALRGAELGLADVACDLAALLGGRDFLRRDGGLPETDLRLRLEAMREARRRDGSVPGRFRGHIVRRGALGRALKEARHWRRRVGRASAGEGAGTGAGADGAGNDVDACGLLLAFAYPDRIARRRSGREGRYLLRNGRGAVFLEPEPVAHEEWIVAADLNDVGRESRVFLAAPVDEEDLREHFADRIEREAVIEWDGERRRVICRRRARLGALVLDDSPLAEPDPDAVVRALLDGVRDEGLGLLPWTRGARRIQERIVFLHRLDPEFPDVSDDALLATLEEWLGPFVYGLKSADDVRKGLDVAQALLARLPWEGRKKLDEWAPDRIEVPSGSRIRVDYSDPESPVLAVRIQELFGLTETPRIAGGRVPLTLHLLSPARRPVQVTQDLAGFWERTYFEVRKDLKGRYPKHYWPDDPHRATATRHTRPRGRTN
ncbi:MAG: ATP-dependent helicase HrpB, partial [Gemmatimonadota bacterium]